MKLKLKNRFSPLLVLLAVVILAAIVATALREGAKKPEEDLTQGITQTAQTDFPLAVTFLDVGQGDAGVIRCENAVIVIDGGEREQAKTVTDYLLSQGIDTVDCYVATHPHSDHIGAAAGIIGGELNVKSVMLTEFSEINTPTTDSWARFLAAADKEEADVLFVKAGEEYTFGSLTLSVLSPAEETTDYNDMSVVLRVSYGKNTFLFTGDASAEIERQILAAGYEVRADVLKIAHHGSSSSTCPEFLQAVAPRLAVISCGRNNDFGHPHRETLQLLKDQGVNYRRTDENGTVTVYGNGKDLYIKE